MIQTKIDIRLYIGTHVTVCVQTSLFDACDRSLTFFCTLNFFKIKILLRINKYVGIQKDDIQNIASYIEHW